MINEKQVINEMTQLLDEHLVTIDKLLLSTKDHSNPVELLEQLKVEFGHIIKAAEFHEFKTITNLAEAAEKLLNYQISNGQLLTVSNTSDLMMAVDAIRDIEQTINETTAEPEFIYQQLLEKLDLEKLSSQLSPSTPTTSITSEESTFNHDEQSLIDEILTETQSSPELEDQEVDIDEINEILNTPLNDEHPLTEPVDADSNSFNDLDPNSILEEALQQAQDHADKNLDLSSEPSQFDNALDDIDSSIAFDGDTSNSEMKQEGHPPNQFENKLFQEQLDHLQQLRALISDEALGNNPLPSQLQDEVNQAIDKLMDYFLKANQSITETTGKML